VLRIKLGNPKRLEVIHLENIAKDVSNFLNFNISHQPVKNYQKSKIFVIMKIEDFQ
jgi:hypothetical protein